jgi:hypothetical protein
MLFPMLFLFPIFIVRVLLQLFLLLFHPISDIRIFNLSFSHSFIHDCVYIYIYSCLLRTNTRVVFASQPDVNEAL